MNRTYEMNFSHKSEEHFFFFFKLGFVIVEWCFLGASSMINQSEFLAITCNLLKAREKSKGYWFWFCFSWIGEKLA